VGDPYWFGVPNSLISERVVKAKHGNNSLMKTAASFETGANYFYLNIQTPQQYNTATGLMEFNRNDMISGYYVVKTVDSSFTSEGYFKQNLDAIRDVGIVTPFIEKSDAQLAQEIRKEDKQRADSKNKNK